MLVMMLSMTISRPRNGKNADSEKTILTKNKMNRTKSWGVKEKIAESRNYRGKLKYKIPILKD